jgi:hypothetical protein
MRALRRRVNEVLESLKQPEPIATQPELLVAEVDPPPPEQETRGDWFARALGDAWVEVEPGIYERAA